MRPPVRAISLGLVAFLGAAWAASLVMAGLWLMTSGTNHWPAEAHWLMLGGVTALMMGQFVFMYLVADRLCPTFARSIGWRIELATIVLFLFALAAAVHLVLQE